MEPKKNPSKDVHRYSKATFLLSLGISIMIMIVAFEWTTEKTITHRPPQPAQSDLFLSTIIPVTAHEPEPVKPQPQKAVVVPAIINVTEVKNDEKVGTWEQPTEVFTDSAFKLVLPEPQPEVVPDKPFLFVEEMPSPKDGKEGFMKFLAKNIRYPSPARRMNIQGRVYVEFIVSETGELSDIHVTKGIGGGCDEEAMRVIRLSKWNAGKQRGRPVKVRMSQMIWFTIQ